MTVAQAVAHCAGSLETALGDRRPPRMLLGRLLAWLIKPLALGDDAPMRKNTPTVTGHAVVDERDLTKERTRLLAGIDRFVAAGRAGVTTHPHGFFGRLTPDEWGSCSTSISTIICGNSAPDGASPTPPGRQRPAATAPRPGAPVR
jgi:hypothetical protein